MYSLKLSNLINLYNQKMRSIFLKVCWNFVSAYIRILRNGSIHIFENKDKKLSDVFYFVVLTLICKFSNLDIRLNKFNLNLLKYDLTILADGNLLNEIDISKDEKYVFLYILYNNLNKFNRENKKVSILLIENIIDKKHLNKIIRSVNPQTKSNLDNYFNSKLNRYNSSLIQLLLFLNKSVNKYDELN